MSVAQDWPAWMVRRSFASREVHAWSPIGERGAPLPPVRSVVVCFYEAGVLTEIEETGSTDDEALARAIARVEKEHSPDAREPHVAGFGYGPSEASALRAGDWIHVGDQRFCVVSLDGDRVDLRGVRGGPAWLRRMPRGGWKLSRPGSWSRAVRW